MTDGHAFTYEGRDYTFRCHAAGDHFDRWYAKHHGFYERGVLEAVRARQRVGTYVDVGSNIGNHAIYFATQCPATVVHGVEPHEELRAVCQMNASENHAPVLLHPCAVADRSMMVTMTPIVESNAHVSDAAEGTTPCYTLDELFPDLADLAVLKLDIEGYEERAIAGAKGLLKRCRPLVVAELLSRGAFRAFHRQIAPFGYATDLQHKVAKHTYLWEQV